MSFNWGREPQSNCNENEVCFMNIYLEHIIIQIKIHIISTCNTVFGRLTKLTFIWHIFVPLTKLLISIYSLTTFNWIQQLSCHTCISLYYTKCFSIYFSSIPNNLSNQFSYTCRDLWNFIFTKNRILHRNYSSELSVFQPFASFS